MCIMKMSAILVDAENTSCWHMSTIMTRILEEESSRNSIPVPVRRIYGDFTKNELTNWKQISLEHSFLTVQQYSYVSKKGTSDQKLTIDALKLLYEKNVNVFYIITSDSDFLPLCLELREQGKTVFGIGKKQTPISFVKACTMFYYIETLESDDLSEKNKVTLCRDTLKEFVVKYRRDDGLVNIGYLKEKLVQSGIDKHLKIKKALLQYPDEIGISQNNSTTYAYIR